MAARHQVSQLDAHLGYWLRYVSNHVSHAFKLKIETRGVTVAEWVVVRALYDVEVGAAHVLADELGLTRGAISKLIDRLVAKSLVKRRPSKSDRRYQELVLTPSGRDLVPQLAALADGNDEEFFGALRRQERDLLADLLKRIVRDRGLKTTPID
jgi:DNA-binding MarR family transcriptional regulator